MKSTRKRAIAWLEDHYGPQEGIIHTSKFYKPYESWPKKRLWWIELSIERMSKSCEKYVHFVCQKENTLKDFYYLKVPIDFLKVYADQFFFRKPKKCFSFYFSAEPDTLFKELRGKGNVDFSNFKQ